MNINQKVNAMTLREELMLKCCLTNSDFGQVSNTDLQVVNTNKVYSYLKSRLSFEQFDDIRAIKEGIKEWIVISNI